MPNKNQDNIPNSNNLFVIYQSQVNASIELVDVITKSGIDKSLVKTVRATSKVMNTALDVIYDSLKKMNSYDIGKSNEAAKTILSTTKAINSLTEVVANINKINPVTVRRAQWSIKKLMTLMFGKPGKDPVGIIPLLEKTGNQKNTKYTNDSIKNLKSISEATRKLIGVAIVLGIASPALIIAVPSIILLHTVIIGLLRTFIIVSFATVPISMASDALYFMASSLKKFVKSITLIGIASVLAAPFISVTMTIIITLVRMVMLMGALSASIKRGSKTFKSISKTLLILSTTVMLMAITGKYIVANWESMLIVGAYLTILIAAFLILAFGSRWINKGTKELVRIALAVGILALTAVLMVSLGQYIETEWESILKTGLMLVVLVGMFMLIGLASRWIEQGGKELLYIALAVGILAIIAILAVWVGNHIQGDNWNGILQISLLIMVLCTPIVAIGLMHKALDKGRLSMIIIVASVAILTGSVMMLAKISNTTDPLELLAVAGILVGIVTAIGAMTIAAGALLVGPQAVIFGLGLVAMGSLSLMVLTMTGVVRSLAKASKAIKEAGLNDAKDAASIVSLPIKVFTTKDKDGKSMIGYIKDLPGVVQMAKYALRISALAKIINSVSRMADILNHISTLNMPDPDKGFDKDGKPMGYKQMSTTDFAKAMTNAGMILMSTVNILGDENVQNKLKNIKKRNLKKLRIAMDSVQGLGTMMDILQHISTLNMPDPDKGFDENGRPKGYRLMTQEDFDKAHESAEKMLIGVVDILGDERMQNKLSDMSKRNLKKLGIVMESVNGLGNIIELIKAMAGGRIASKWEKDTDPKSPTYGQEVAVEYINIVDYINKNRGRISNTIEKIIMCPIDAISSISDNKARMKKVKNAKDASGDIADVINTIKQPITDLVDLYNDKLSSINAETIQPSYEGIILGVLNPFTAFDTTKMITVQKSTLVVFERVAKTMSNIDIKDNVAANFQNNVKETVGLLKTVDSVNLDKLKAADSLMKHIAVLSKTINGNFKELAHAINEDLLDALKNLTDTLDKVKETDFNVTTAGSVISQPSGSAGVKDKKEQPTTPARNITKDDINKITKAINELYTRINRVISSDNKVQVNIGT